MKVLWLSHLVPYPPKGGVLQRAYYMVRELSKYHEVDLLAFVQPDLIRPLYESVELGLEDAREALEPLCSRLEFCSIESTSGLFGKPGLALCSLLTKDSYTINWLKSEQYMSAVGRYIDSGAYDLVHFDTISLIPYKKLVGPLPTVLDHHNIESHMLLRRAQNESHFLKKWYFDQEGRRLQAIEVEACHEFSLNITCSDMDKERLADIDSRCVVEVVPNGVDVEYFSPSKVEPQEPSLIFIGTLNWYPNIEAVRYIANELWPLLKAKIPQLSVDIVGANPPDDIRSFAEQEAGFNVHGFVDDIRPMMDRAAIYVCPIMDGGGTKLKILDALSMGKAIVAHPIACEGIDVSDGGNILFANNPSEYVEKIITLINDPSERARIGENARALAVSSYSYESIGRSLADLYEETVRESSTVDSELGS